MLCIVTEVRNHNESDAKMKNKFKLAHNRLAFSLAGIFCISSTAFAAQPPDAGRTLQEMVPVLSAPENRPGITVAAPEITDGLAGGTQVDVTSVTFSGNTKFTEEVLRGVLGELSGKTYDMAAMKGLANLVSRYYRNHGYPFARAFLPPQPLTDGALRIDITEGCYGAIQAKSEDPRAGNAQSFLSDLQTGAVIESAALERATLILDDQPGFKSSPVVRPGQQTGAGDLDVLVERVSRFSGEVGLDNYGNRYTGNTRGHLDLFANSPFIFGDKVTLRTMLTSENMWMGEVGYSRPLGSSGLRGTVSYNQNYYQLGKEFANLKAHGTAKVSSVGLSYPLVRSQNTNVTLSSNLQEKKLQDIQDVAITQGNKSSLSLPITLNFDRRDTLGGGGVTYGSFSWTHGNLSLDTGLAATDLNTAKTAGNYDKLNLDVSRLQALPANFTLYGRFSAQLTNKNLDSSEGFGLGGPSGVRAYPSGEGYGNEGMLAQLELRYAVNMFAPYVFVDGGNVRINHTPWAAGNNHRSIGGDGFGVRINHKDWNADVSVAWHTYGGIPQSDSNNNTPMAWATLGYKF